MENIYIFSESASKQKNSFKAILIAAHKPDLNKQMTIFCVKYENYLFFNQKRSETSQKYFICLLYNFNI